MSFPAETKRIVFVSVIAAVWVMFLFVAVGIADVIVPYNMDEFMPYRWLFCTAFVHTASASAFAQCSAYDLQLPWTSIVLPLRSFDYAGSTPVIFYAPVFAVWHDLASVRLIGLLFLTLQAWLLTRLFPIRMWVAGLALLGFFPYFFQHLVDTGPVALHTTSVFLFVWLCSRWCSDPRWIYPLAGGVLLFLCLWTKLIYLLLLPGLALLGLYCIIRQSQAFVAIPPGKIFRHCLLFVGVAGVLTGLYMLSTAPGHPDQYPILQQIMRGDSYDLAELRDRLSSLPAVSSVLHPLEATQRSFDLQISSLSVLLYALATYLFIPLFLLLSLWQQPSRWKHIAEGGFLYSLFLLTLFLVVRTKLAWATHHTILAFPFLILSFGITIGLVLDSIRHESAVFLRRIFLVMGMIFFIITWHAFLYFDTQQNATLAAPQPGEKVMVAEGERLKECAVTDDGPAISVLYGGKVGDESHLYAVRKFSILHGMPIVFRMSPGFTMRDYRIQHLRVGLADCDDASIQ
jgi:hypothetical protein